MLHRPDAWKHCIPAHNRMVNGKINSSNGIVAPSDKAHDNNQLLLIWAM